MTENEMQALGRRLYKQATKPYFPPMWCPKEELAKDKKKWQAHQARTMANMVRDALGEGVNLLHG